MQYAGGAWSRHHALLMDRWHAYVVRREPAHCVRRLLDVLTRAWLTARRVRHGGGAYVWRTGQALYWDDGRLFGSSPSRV